MAALQDVDGLLLFFNQTFLTKLQQEKFSFTKLRVKFFGKGKSTTYRTFANFAEFQLFFKATLEDPNLQCAVGRAIVIESVNIINNKLNFPNSYYARTIPTLLNVQENFKYDSFRDTKIKTRSDVYQKYLYKRFTNYMKDINMLLSIQNETYIDECYIEKFYFEKKFAELLTV